MFATVLTRGDLGLDLSEWFVAVYAPGFLVAGWWLRNRRPDLVIGNLFLLAALSVAIAGATAAYAGAALVEGWPAADWTLWTYSWLWQLHLAVLSVGILLLPNGRIEHRVQRWLIVAVVVVAAAAIANSFLRYGAIVTTPDKPAGPVPGLYNPIGIESLDSFTDALATPLLALSLMVGLTPIVYTALWWRRSRAHVRSMFRWLTVAQLAGLSVPVLLGVAPALAGVTAVGQTLALQLLIAYAIIRWHAYDVEVGLRRSVLFTALLMGGLGTYALVVVAVSAVVGSDSSVPTTVGAAVAIFAFGPLSVWIRRTVNRVFYGRRDDPYAVVAELGRQSASASDPGAALDAIVDGLTVLLRLPHASVSDASGTVLAQRGDATDSDDEVVELTHQGRFEGTLTVGRRRGGGPLTPAELELLQTLSRQIGAAIDAFEMLEGLRRARQRLVVAREDERRRIQRDLHDGLGPQLTGVTLELDAARNHLAAGRSEQAGRLIASARQALHSSVADVRRLVYSLGDPTLASLGLRSALAERVDQITRNSGVVTTVVVAELPPLSAAQEEAVAMIVGEAVTNVVRHAHARTCRVEVRQVGAELVVEVTDNGAGCGRNDPLPQGVGTRSMRERAAELGGTLAISEGTDTGTVVCLVLPLSHQTEPA